MAYDEPKETTDSEVEFLDGVFHGRWVRKHTPERAKAAIENYRRKLMTRKFDGEVDVDFLFFHATRLLRKFK